MSVGIILIGFVGGMGHIWASCNCPECDYIGSKDVSSADMREVINENDP